MIRLTVAAFLLFAMAAAAQVPTWTDDPFGSSGAAKGGTFDPAPTIETSSASVVYGTANGTAINVRFNGTTSETAYYEVKVTYSSSYVQYEWPATENYIWKTAANGKHEYTTVILASSLVNYDLEIGPRCYHSDGVVASMVAIGSTGSRSAPVVLLDITLEVPIGTIPTSAHDEYGVSTRSLWSRDSSTDNAPDVDHVDYTIANYAKPDVLLSVTNFLFEGPWTTPGWDHFIDRIRADGGSHNQAFLGFSGLNVKAYNNNPWKRRLNMMFDAESTADVDYPAGDYGDSLYCRHVDGTLMDEFEGQGLKVINVTSDMARQMVVTWWVDEWNHCENRRPKVGLMFDVYEYQSEFRHPPLLGGPQTNGVFVVDHDLNGISLMDPDDTDDNDDPEIHLVREGRILLFSMIHAGVAASAVDTDVGDYFLLGANTWSGLTDEDFTAELDMVLEEGHQCPVDMSTEFLSFADDPYYDNKEHFLYSRPYLATYTNLLEHRQDHYLYNDLIASNTIPNPSDINMTFAGLVANMRTDGGGPWILVGSQQPWDWVSGEDEADVVGVQPTRQEVLALLGNNIYPSYHHQDGGVANKQLWHPDLEGEDDLKGLGAATGSIVRATFDGRDLWTRAYTSGSVSILIASSTDFDCAAGDSFEYQVVISSSPVRESDDWVDPSVFTIDVMTFTDDLAENSTQELSISVVEAGTWWWRWRGIVGASEDPSTLCESWGGPPFYNSWSSWVSRGTDLVDFNTGMTEVNDLWNSVQVEVSGADGGPYTDFECDGFKTPK